MTNLKQYLNTLADTAIADVIGGDGGGGANVVTSSRPEFGDYQANGLMAIAKRRGEKPRELAEDVCKAIARRDDPLIGGLKVAGPGFINIRLAPRRLAELADGILQRPAEAVPAAARPQTVAVDYSSPNLAKEMHVGHLRGTIIGDCLVRVLERLGHRVIRQNHVGDWGTQFGTLIAYLQELQAAQQQVPQTQKEQQASPKQQTDQANGDGDLPAQLADLEKFYRDAKARFDEDPAFADRAREAVVKLQSGDPASLQAWRHFIDESMGHCGAVYARLNVTLTRDDMEPESFYNSKLPGIVARLDKLGLLSVSDEAKCVFLDEFKGKDGTPLPMIVQKSGGGYLYATTDLASVQHRSRELKVDRSLYVVDVRQTLHFQQVFAVARRAGFASDSIALEHIAYGTVMGKDGKPYKTRSGDTVKLTDLLDEAVRRATEAVRAKNPSLDKAEHQRIGETVGIAAVKYADLSKNRSSDYIFDWTTMLSFDGNTAPYLLYAYARICSVLRKYSGDAKELRIVNKAEAEMHPAELELLLKNLQLAETVHQVAEDCYPNQLCNYLYDLAGSFMRFYESCPILKADPPTRDSRLALAHLTAASLKEGLNLLGIEPLERM